MTYARASFGLVLLLLVSCGGRRGDPDAGTPDAGGPECAVDTECGDGVACTIDQCVEGACVSEPCEGCCAEPLVCVLDRGCAMPPASCDEHADCDDGVRCTLDECDGGSCEHQAQSGLCEDGEMCLADAGCVPARDECQSAADCAMGRACDGTWRCDAEFGCQYEGPVDCDDDDSCTADACDEDAGGCVHETIDVDMDGDAPLACGGGDCDDGDGAVHDGATESCNEVDDDCDGEVDEEACAPTIDCGTGDLWRATSTVDAPAARYWHGAVWTGREMMIWGGNSEGGYDATGGLYDPATDTWRPTATEGAPSGRLDHVMVWTGDEVLVWGGRNNSGPFANGARFDPDTNTWAPMSTANAPPARSEPQAVWTGTELLVWGDDSVEGGRYDPATDTWTRTSTTDAPSARDKFFMVWTGSEAIVWGGRACGGGSCPYVSTGARYATASNSWTAMSTAGAPTGAAWGSAVWTGAEMIVFGGRTCGFVTGCEVDSGGLYAPATNTWRAFASAGRPSARHNHSGVWTGDRMLIWGGGGSALDTGALYDPVGDAWTPMSTVDAPSGRRLHTGVWADEVFITWGGLGGASLDTGGVYCPPAP